MANVKTVLVQTNNTALSGNASTWKAPLATSYGFFAVATGEAIIQRPSGVYSNLRCRVVTNTNNNTTVLRVKNNGANGNNSISITTTQTGSFEDITHTDTVTTGNNNTFLEAAVVNQPTGSITFAITQIDFLADSDTHATISSHGGAVLSAASTTVYHSISATLANTVTAESQAQTQFRNSYTLKNFRVRITADSRSTNTTYKIRKNGADGNQSISTTTTGEFEDTTNTDSVVSNDKICVSSTTSTGTGSQTFGAAAIDVENTTNSEFPFITTCAPTGQPQNFGLTRYESGGGHILGLTTETSAQVKLYKPSTLKDLTVNVITNTVNGTTTVRTRNNSANANPVVTIGSSTTGFFTDDASTTDTVAGDLVNFSIVTAGSSGSITYTSFYLDIETRFDLFLAPITESTISVSDSNTRVKTVPRSITESSITVSDSNTRLLNAFRTISESSISVGDSNTRLRTAFAPISESTITVSDSNTRLLLAQRSIAESSISVSDSLARVKTIIRAINEASITVSDSLARLLIATRSISESSISVSDALARILIATRTISESSITVSDALARMLTAFRTITEASITVSDAGSDGYFLATRTINEASITVSDALARLLIATRPLPETVTVSDSVARTTLSVRAISESSISVSDSLDRIPVRVRFLEDTIEVSDALGRYTLQIRNISESTINVSDSLERILIALRSIAESSISVSESLARSTVLPRSINEPSITVGDSLARTGYYNRALAESSISISDSLARVKTIIRLINESSISVSEALARLLLANRSLADTITVSDALTRPALKKRTISEASITVSDSLAEDETKLRSISETVIVSDVLARNLKAFRTISEPSIIISEILVGIVPVPVLAEFITDPGYTNPLRFRVTWKSKLTDTTADESGDQVIYYQYDSFVPEAKPFNITDFSMRLTQGEISSASLTIEDHKGQIADTRKIGFKSIVEVEFKKELGREWERILTGFVRRVRTLRPAYRAISYQITILSKQIVDSERIIDFKRAAQRSAIDSNDVVTSDSNMLANKLYREIYESVNHFPRRNSPSVKTTAEYDLDTGTISDEVTDFITEIAPGLTTVAETTNQLTEGIGAIKGVDVYGNPYLRYPTEKHSGIIITDSPADTDSALNTSVNMASFDFEDVIDVAEGFANRIYVLNSKDTKSTAGSSKASGFTTLTTRWIAQSFIAIDTNVNAAAFILSTTGTPTNTSGTIKGLLTASDASGTYPTGAVLATFEISLSSISSTKDTIFVNDLKTKDGVIIPGQKYWWVLQGNDLFDSTATVNWHHDNDLVTGGRNPSAILPTLVDVDPTTPGNQAIWVVRNFGPVYSFSTFSSINHILTQADPESIRENGLIEAIVNLPAFSDDSTYRKVLVKILQYSSKIKRIFSVTKVTIPTARLFRPGELVTFVDSKAKMELEKTINAEIVEVSYNFDLSSNALGCKYVDLRLVGFIDNVLDDYLENKEC